MILSLRQFIAKDMCQVARQICDEHSRGKEGASKERSLKYYKQLGSKGQAT